MEKSEVITDLAKALLKFHSIVGKIAKDAKNPFFKSDYATLSHILEEVQSPLQDCGLLITQWPEGTALITILLHAETGQFMQSTYEMPIAKQNDPQAVGSSISYARRYAISSILSLNISDDDGNAASGKGKKQAQETPEKPWLNPGDKNWPNVVKAMKDGFALADIMKKYAISKVNQEKLQNEVNK